jgi:peroxiredoxin family protein
LEKQIQAYKEENKSLKVEANSKIYDCNKEMDNIRIRYESDREELLNVN